ncbi:hypothetical protein JYU34_002996 [Plutella xylostella]|uniref:Uncharacterized protein n=1 Tax=Plutella xylostella TaxID=51655 RepID=A0ABQ7R3Q1_PLUXY|nr:hypothetical protein JYU34_002996 [Plutella xylostella]
MNVGLHGTAEFAVALCNEEGGEWRSQYITGKDKPPGADKSRRLHKLAARD